MKGSMGKVEASCILSLKKLYFCMSWIEKDNIKLSKYITGRITKAII